MTKFIHIIDRKTAQLLGMRTYFTGVPCKRRQVSERAVSNARCLSLLCESLSLFKSYEYKKANLGRVNENRRKSEKAARTAPHNPTFTEKPN